MIKEMLQLYKQASGQCINIEKSAILFSSNVSQPTKMELKNFLGVTKSLEDDNYLGFPLMIGRNKRRVFDIIRERINKKIEGWQGKVLSQAAKGVLIKSVAQAIPTYIMSCFFLPKTFVAKLNSMLSNFWWGVSNGRQKIHWLSWNKLCVSKRDGGQGFRDFEAFNLGLLAKQWWRVMQDESLLSHQIFKARYFPNCSMHEARLGSSPSYLWRSLYAGKQVIDKGSIWRIGTGDFIKLWEDKWVWKCQEGRIKPREEFRGEEQFVAEWIDHEARMWKCSKVVNAVQPMIAEWIISIPISSRPTRDKLIWRHSNDGILTAKSAYIVAIEVLGREVPNRAGRCNGWKALWSAKVMPKIKNHGWKMLHGIHPTTSALRRKGVDILDQCPVCGQEGENIWHLYLECELSKQIWTQACAWVLEVPRSDENPLLFWERWMQEGIRRNELELCLSIGWAIWKN